MGMEELQGILKEKNFLGALLWIRESHLDRLNEGKASGLLADALVRELDRARASGDKEQVHYHRALLAYCLRDYPGLSALYRDQIRTERDPGLIGRMDQAGRTISDVLSGKISVEAGIREGMEQAGRQAEEAGIPLERMVREGMNKVGEFFGFSSRTTDRGQEGTKSSGHTPTMRPSAGTDGDDTVDGASIKVNIESADVPLPDNIQPTGPETTKE